MSLNSKNVSPEVQVDVLRSFVLSKTQRYSVNGHRVIKKPNSYLKAGIREELGMLMTSHLLLFIIIIYFILFINQLITIKNLTDLHQKSTWLQITNSWFSNISK